MSDIDKDIVKDFVIESKGIIQDLIELLESIEGDFSQVAKLEEFGQKVDRIMGGAKSLALLVPQDHPLHMVADYADLCKAVGYKASQIQDNAQFFDICVALLLDATETLEEWIEGLGEDRSAKDLKDSFSSTFLERLRWASNQFGADVRSSVDAQKSKKMGQNDIDELLRKLGVG